MTRSTASSGKPSGISKSTCSTQKSSNRSLPRRNGARSACGSRGWWRTSTTAPCSAWTAAKTTPRRTPSSPPESSFSPSKSLGTERAVTAWSTAVPGGRRLPRQRERRRGEDGRNSPAAEPRRGRKAPAPLGVPARAGGGSWRGGRAGLYLPALLLCLADCK